MNTDEKESVDSILAEIAVRSVGVPQRTRVGLFNSANTAIQVVPSDGIQVDTGGVKSDPQRASLAHEALVEEYSRNPTIDLLSLTVRVGALCRELRRHEHG